jgi:uncharacterized protein YndB with AHSA1/START domain
MSESDLVSVRREIAASAEELFDAWLDADSLAQWMRPMGIPRTTAKVDARVGGAFEVVMHGTDGDIRHTGHYRTIDRPHRLSFTWYSPATQQRETVVTVEFRPARGKTEVVVTHERLPGADARRSHTTGWSDALDLLARKFAAQRTA